MHKFKERYTVICIIVFLVFIMTTTIAIIPILSPGVEAASINNEDIYKGMAIAALLYLLARGGKDTDVQEVESRELVKEIKDYQQKDVDLLAKVINAEARGEPYNGQVAVGAVVLNRVKHSDFPNNIRDVIYQDEQFTSVNNGQFNLVPGINAYNAAYDALDGIDPSHGALYFYNPKKARTLWWLETRKKTVIIGEHVFAK